MNLQSKRVCMAPKQAEYLKSRFYDLAGYLNYGMENLLFYGDVDTFPYERKRNMDKEVAVTNATRLGEWVNFTQEDKVVQ